MKAAALKKPAAPLEHDEQKALFEWATVSAGKYRGLDRLFAVPNGGHRLKAAAGKMKAEGAKTGVPDTCLPVPLGGFLGLWIEMKRRGMSGRALGDRSQEQVGWQEFLVSQGYAVCTCYGWDAAAAAIKAYYGGTLVMPEGGDCAFWGGVKMDNVTKRVDGNVPDFSEFLREIQCRRVLVIAEGLDGVLYSHERDVTDGSMTATQERLFIERLKSFEKWILEARDNAAARERGRVAVEGK